MFFWWNTFIGCSRCWFDRASHDKRPNRPRQSCWKPSCQMTWVLPRPGPKCDLGDLTLCTSIADPQNSECKIALPRRCHCCSPFPSYPFFLPPLLWCNETYRHGIMKQAANSSQFYSSVHLAKSGRMSWSTRNFWMFQRQPDLWKNTHMVQFVSKIQRKRVRLEQRIVPGSSEWDSCSMVPFKIDTWKNQS